MTTTSDLQDKFDALESQLTTQHTALMGGIDAILAALGAPPPGDVTTLDDIAAQLTTLNSNLLAIQSDNSSYYASSLDVLGLLSSNLEILNNNSSYNAQRLIATIYNTACQCPTPVTTLTPPLDLTPTSLEDEAKCRRIQFYLHLFSSWLDKIANYGGSASFITGDTLVALLALATTAEGLVATGIEVGAAGGPPGAVIGAIVGLIIAAIFTLGASVLNDYASQFRSPEVQSALLTAMFAATNAADGYNAFQTVVGSSFSVIPAGILNALFWTQWTNDIYGTSPVVDDSMFDGTICTSSEVVDCIHVPTITTPYGHNSSDWPSATPPQPTGGSGDLVYATPAAGILGYTLTNLTPVGVGINAWINEPSGGHGHAPIGEGWVVESYPSGTSIEIYGSDSTVFSFDMCPP